MHCRALNSILCCSTAAKPWFAKLVVQSSKVATFEPCCSMMEMEAKTPVKQPSGLAAAVIAAAKAESSQEREPKEHKVDAQRVEKV